MAYTKTPSFDTHQTLKIPFVGNRSLTSTPTAAHFSTAMGYVNCEPRTVRQWGTDPERVVMRRQPIGKISASTTTIDPIIAATTSKAGRGAFVCVTSANKVYTQGGLTAFDYLFDYPTFLVDLAIDPNVARIIGICDFYAAGTNYLCFLSQALSDKAGTLYLYNLATGVLTNTALGFSVTTTPVFLDGYIFIAGYPTASPAPYTKQRIYNCAVGNPSSWTPANDFIEAESTPDNGISLVVYKNQLVLFGTFTTEFFTNSAYQLGSPLSRQSTYIQKVGMTSNAKFVNSAGAFVGDDYYFLGHYEGGGTSLMKLSNFQIEPVPDIALQAFLDTADYELNTYNIHAVSNWGTPGLLIQIMDVNSGSKLLYYNIVENVSSEWTFKSTLLETATILSTRFAADSRDAGFFKAKPTIYFQSWDGYFVMAKRSNDYVDTLTVPSVIQEDITASYTTPILDFSSQRMKHFIHTDVQGELNGNSITLSLTNDMNYDTFVDRETITPSTTVGNVGLVRWRNLGRARNRVYRVTIDGLDNFVLRSMEVAYNLGSS